MSCRTNRILIHWTLGVAAMLATGLAAGQENTDRAADPATETTSEKPAEKADPFVVPSGTPEELLKYIDGLKQARPSSGSREAAVEFLKKQSHALLEASEKILAAKPNPEQGRAAVQYELVALQLAAKLGDGEASKKLTDLPATLEKNGMKQFAREARGGLLRLRLEQTEELDRQQYMELLKDVKRFLAEGEPDATAAALAMDAATGAEITENTDLAILAYNDFAKFLAKSTDRKILNLAASMQGAARRLGLLGQKLRLEATKLDGKPFQWSKYQGKVILVDFFATWCAPCRAEMVNIAKNYKTYHDRGFEVVTISIDRDRKAIREFVEQSKYPWTFVLDSSEGLGTDKSMSTYYGVMSVPQTILVDRDGTVVALNPMGPDLAAQLGHLIGPAEQESSKEATQKTSLAKPAE